MQKPKRQLPGSKPSSKTHFSSSNNPFAAQRNKAPKFEVINRRLKGSARDMSKAGEAADSKRAELGELFARRKNVNTFEDRRFGENDVTMSVDEKMMQRFVKERTRGVSAQKGRFNLAEDDDEGGENSTSKKRKRVAGKGDNDNNMGGLKLKLTHKGSNITDEVIKNDPFNHGDDSDDDKDPYKALDKADTSLHFGGGKLSKANVNPYGPYGAQGEAPNLGDMYRSRKNELDDVIKMSKVSFKFQSLNLEFEF